MQDISIHKFSFWVKLSFAFFCFLVVLDLLVLLSDREQYLLKCNSWTSPLVDIIQGLIKIVGCGWSFTVNVVSCCP